MEQSNEHRRAKAATFWIAAAMFIIGSIIAAVGLISGLLAVAETAATQAVAALWMLSGIGGLIIAAIGLATLAIAGTIERLRQDILSAGVLGATPPEN